MWSQLMLSVAIRYRFRHILHAITISTNQCRYWHLLLLTRSVNITLIVFYVLQFGCKLLGKSFHLGTLF